MTKLGKMSDLFGIYFRPNSISPIVSRDLVNNIKSFSGDEGGGITLYSCLTPNHIDNLLESPNKLDILSQKKRD